MRKELTLIWFWNDTLIKLVLTKGCQESDYSKIYSILSAKSHSKTSLASSSSTNRRTTCHSISDQVGCRGPRTGHFANRTNHDRKRNHFKSAIVIKRADRGAISGVLVVIWAGKKPLRGRPPRRCDVGEDGSVVERLEIQQKQKFYYTGDRKRDLILVRDSPPNLRVWKVDYRINPCFFCEALTDFVRKPTFRASVIHSFTFLHFPTAWFHDLPIYIPRSGFF